MGTERVATRRHRPVPLDERPPARGREQPLRAAVGVAGLTVRREPGGPDVLGGTAVSPQTASALSRLRGAGVALPESVAGPMGDAMGADLSGVRVHADPEADQLSRSLQATAFTHGSDVYFTQGAYAPGTQGGQRLLAHELAHVVQGRAGVQLSAAGQVPVVGFAADPAEAAADAMAETALARLQRQPLDREPSSEDAAGPGIERIRRTPTGVIRRGKGRPVGTATKVAPKATKSPSGKEAQKAQEKRTRMEEQDKKQKALEEYKHEKNQNAAADDGNESVEEYESPKEAKQREKREKQQQQENARKNKDQAKRDALVLLATQNGADVPIVNHLEGLRTEALTTAVNTVVVLHAQAIPALSMLQAIKTPEVGAAAVKLVNENKAASVPGYLAIADEVAASDPSVWRSPRVDPRRAGRTRPTWPGSCSSPTGERTRGRPKRSSSG